MKYITLTVILFAVPAWNVQAGELSVSTGQRSMESGGDDWTIGDWNYIQITYKPEDSNFYYGLSQEEAEVSPISYFSWTYNVLGLVAGVESKLTDSVSLFGQIGYYKISNDISNDYPIPEGVHYYFQRKFNGWSYSWEKATLENSDAFGGTIGIKITQPISDNIKVGLLISRRIMKIREVLRVYFPNDGGIWAVGTNRDYSSTSFGVNLNYAF